MKKCKESEVKLNDLFIARDVGKKSLKSYSALFLKTKDSKRIVSLDNFLLADMCDMSPSGVRDLLDQGYCIVVGQKA